MFQERPPLSDIVAKNPGKPPTNYVSGHLLVVFVNSVTEERIREIIKAHNGILDNLIGRRTASVCVPIGSEQATCEALEKEGDVLSARQQLLMKAMSG